MSQIFISYHHDDFDFAVNMRRELQGAGFHTWMDDEGIYAGEDWRQEIDRAIRESFALIAILSPKAVDSEYVTYEWSFALGTDIKVIPILFRQTDKLHPRLTSLQYEDFTNRLSRPWNRLLARLEQIGKQTATNTRPAPQTATIHVADDVPSFFKEAVAALDSSDAKLRVAAVTTLSQNNLPAAREALRLSLKHPFNNVRLAAANSLGYMGDVNDVPALIDAFKSENTDGYVQSEIVKALGRIGDSSAVPLLLDVLKLGDPSIQWIAVVSLEQIGHPSAVPALLELLTNTDKDLQERVIKTLIRIGEPNAIPAVFDVLKQKNKSFQREIVRELRNFRDSTVVLTLLDVLKSADKSVQGEVIRTLGFIGDPHAFPILLDILKNADKSIQRTIIVALERIGTPEALAAVEEWRKQQGNAQS